MPERVTPLLPVTVEYLCDECGTPVQRSTIPDIGRDSLILHECPQCHSVYRLDGNYPRQHYINFMAWLNDIRELLR